MCICEFITIERERIINDAWTKPLKVDSQVGQVNSAISTKGCHYLSNTLPFHTEIATSTTTRNWLKYIEIFQIQCLLCHVLKVFGKLNKRLIDFIWSTSRTKFLSTWETWLWFLEVLSLKIELTSCRSVKLHTDDNFAKDLLAKFIIIECFLCFVFTIERVKYPAIRKLRHL